MMAPSAEILNSRQSMNKSSASRNVALAINYELAMVDRFWDTRVSPRIRKKTLVDVQDDVGNCTTSTADHCPALVDPSISCISSSNGSRIGDDLSKKRSALSSNLENSAPNVPVVRDCELKEATSQDRNGPEKTVEGVISSALQERNQANAGLSADRPRRSCRDPKKKPDGSLEKTRVRYDMERVPGVERNRDFLASFPIWWMKKLHDQEKSLSEGPDALNTPSSEIEEQRIQNPFNGNSSVLWIPQKRSEWEDSVAEMTAVCTSASWRKFIASRDNAETDKSKQFVAPLSRQYIRDRVDIDDPLRGYQIRHKTGGWLQGFLLWTNFTTWTHCFKFDSLDARSGVPSHAASPNVNHQLVDVGGSLAAELEAQPRSGDPLGGGVVFATIAEIALIGGLGCGEYLLRMALDRILIEKRYKYIVLQATDGSKSFYERFGFVRVGAVCRYQNDPLIAEGKEPNICETPIVGYRHWTHPNESKRSLELHGGPSYMMCLKIDTDYAQFPRYSTQNGSSTMYLDRMMSVAVDAKPTIEQIGGSSTPFQKTSQKAGFGERSFASPTPRRFGISQQKSSSRRSSARGPSASQTTLPKTCPSSTPLQSMAVLPSSSLRREKRTELGKRQASNVFVDGCDDTEASKSTKKRKLHQSEKKSSENVLLSPPSPGKPLTYVQKQYYSVWLAVSPKAEMKTNRRPPRDRAGAEGQNGKGVSAPGSDQESSTEHNTSAGSIATCGKEQKEKPARQTVDVPKSARRRSVMSESSRSTENTPPQVTPKGTSGGSNSEECIKARLRAGGRTTLMKQKVKSYPRDRIHYYNKVVRLKTGNDYFFVLNYDEPSASMVIVRMEARGVLTGKRQGRPRFQTILDESGSGVQTVPTSEYEVVPAFMVMKTPYVASEAWDILDEM